MAGLRNKFIHTVCKGAGIIPTTLLQKVSGQQLILPFYHAISDEPMPHIRHLYPVKGVKAFIQDLDFLLKYYTPIDYDEFRALAKSGEQPKKPAFLLSFDDGLREFYDVIAPLLLEKGVPAICFLNSGFIDNKDLFYRYKASLLIGELVREPALSERIKEVFDGSKTNAEHLLAMTYQNRELLDAVAGLIGYRFSDFLASRSPYLTSEQIRRLKEQGFHFGAHSIDHPQYQYIGLLEQLRQTEESINTICNIYSIDYKIFSFPFTDYKVSAEFFRRLQAEDIADHTFGCAGLKKDTAPHHFQRIPFEMANLSGRQILNSELMYYLLKMPLGKNVIRRS